MSILLQQKMLATTLIWVAPIFIIEPIIHAEDTIENEPLAYDKKVLIFVKK